jgi:hypothetical protein
MKRLAIALLLTASLVAVLATDGLASAVGSGTSQKSSPGTASTDVRLVACGASMPNQSRLLTSYEVQSAALLYAAIPHLPAVGELSIAKPPFFVALFDGGVFKFPVPLIGDPAGLSFWSEPHTILCIFHDGIPSFYADVDFAGRRDPPG